MASIGLFEAKARLSEIVRKAEQGEVTTITVNGKPMAQVVPLSVAKPQYSEEEREAAFQRLRNPQIKGISGEEVLAAIREGRH